MAQLREYEPLGIAFFSRARIVAPLSAVPQRTLASSATYVSVLTIYAQRREPSVSPVVLVLGALSQFPKPATGSRGEMPLPKPVGGGSLPRFLRGPSRRLHREGNGGGAHAAVPPPIWLSCPVAHPCLPSGRLSLIRQRRQCFSLLAKARLSGRRTPPAQPLMSCVRFASSRHSAARFVRRTAPRSDARCR